MPRTLKRRVRKLKRRGSSPKQARPARHSVETVDFIGSGCSTLNLALSGKAKDGGWARARVDNIVGDKSSGKTAVALEACFWYYNNIKKVRSKVFPNVKDFTIVYNNAEGVMDFDIQYMYGPAFYDTVEWIRSPSVEHFGRDYTRRVNDLNHGESLLYIVDTLDFLKSKDALARWETSVKKEEELAGSYDVEKQKYLSGFFAVTSEYINNNEFDATLLILSQVRAKIGVTFGKKTMRTGGKAFDHAIHQEAWLREVEKKKATRRGGERVYAIRTEVNVEKNKCAKPYRKSQFTILYDYGIDNINSLIDYVYGPEASKIKYDGKQFKSRKEFVKFIEANDYEKNLETQAEIKWQEIEEAFEKEVSQRKRRW